MKIKKLSRFLTGVLALTLCMPAFATTAPAAEGADKSPPKPGFANDGDRLEGDRLILQTMLRGLTEVDRTNAPTVCAPVGAKAVVWKTDDTNVYLYFVDSKLFDKMKPNDQFVLGESEACSGARLGIQYKVSRAQLANYAYKRSGFTFGALVVPFKYYTSGDKRISSSSTIAPFVGWRNNSMRGITLTPVVSAGLGLVPVATSTAEGAKSEVRSAFSTALGLRLTSSKNEAFSAGLIVGKDFLSKSDRALDPTVGKTWVSIYLGLSL